VINITDGEATDGDPTSPANALKNLASKDGGVLLFNIHVSSKGATPVEFADTDATLPDEFSKLLYTISRSGEVEKSFVLNSKTRFYSIAADPGGKYIALGLGKRDIIVWDVAAQSSAACLEGHRRKVLSVAFSTDGRTLVSGSADMSVRIWNIANRTCDAVLHGHTNDVNAVHVSPDGKWIASAGDDGVIFVWDAASFKPAVKITAGAPVHALAFDPSGAFLISGGADRMIRCWDVRTGRTIGTLDGHDGAVRGISVSKDGEKLASCGEDGRVICWTRANRKAEVI